MNAFPQLPPAVQDALTRRGCLIPQTYEAHGPENVVHASLERRGSSDWAVLCSANGAVSLLVFFAGSGEPTVLATAPETERLQSHGSSNVLGFNWAIDPASPEDVHEAQLGMRHPPPRLDHDAIADSVIDGRTDLPLLFQERLDPHRHPGLASPPLSMMTGRVRRSAQCVDRPTVADSLTC